jgi:hypothetical protein
VSLACNELKVVCSNPLCKYYRIPRTATFPVIGAGLYIGGSVLCVCGMAPRVTEKGQSTYDKEPQQR